MKNIILIRNLDSKEKAKEISEALSETRADYEVNLEKQCVIVEGNADMVIITRKIISDLGFRIV